MVLVLGKKVLLFTNSEFGQANVFLAVAYELLQRGHEVHIASYDRLAKRVQALNDGQYGKLARKAEFHQINGEAMFKVVDDKYGSASEFRHGSGIRKALKSYPILVQLACVWDGPEYVQAYQSCCDFIEMIKPDIIVVERLCLQAVDACKNLGQDYLMMTPNTLKETISTQQPLFDQLCRFPADNSGFPFPVPWYWWALNFYLQLRLVLALFSSDQFKNLSRVRKENSIKGPIPYLEPYSKDVHYLVPSTPECDFPYSCIPDNVTPCGPITLPSDDLSIVDPELEIWLSKRQTVLLNLGSLYGIDPPHARELARGLQLVLDQHPNIQIYWKLMMKDGLAKTPSEAWQVDRTVVEMLSSAIQSDQVRIVGWIKAEPGKILMHRNVICSVHHGGANSYYEAVIAGTPQIVMPCWHDTFDFAERVELLGIGVHGSRKAAPVADAREFGNALITVLGGNHKERAKSLAESVARYGGRKLAADKIIELAELFKKRRELIVQ